MERGKERSEVAEPGGAGGSSLPGGHGAAAGGGRRAGPGHGGFVRPEPRCSFNAGSRQEPAGRPLAPERGPGLRGGWGRPGPGRGERGGGRRHRAPPGRAGVGAPGAAPQPRPRVARPRAHAARPTEGTWEALPACTGCHRAHACVHTCAIALRVPRGCHKAGGSLRSIFIEAPKALRHSTDSSAHAEVSYRGCPATAADLSPSHLCSCKPHPSLFHASHVEIRQI